LFGGGFGALNIAGATGSLIANGLSLGLAGYSAINSAVNIGQNGLNWVNGFDFALSAVGTIASGYGVRSSLSEINWLNSFDEFPTLEEGLQLLRRTAPEYYGPLRTGRLSLDPSAMEPELARLGFAGGRYIPGTTVIAIQPSTEYSAENAALLVQEVRHAYQLAMQGWAAEFDAWAAELEYLQTNNLLTSDQLSRVTLQQFQYFAREPENAIMDIYNFLGPDSTTSPGGIYAQQRWFDTTTDRIP